MGTVLNSISSLIGSGTGPEEGQPQASGGLANLMERMMNNPTMQQMISNPSVQRVVEEVVSDESQDFGTVMNRMLPMVGPVMSEILGGMGTPEQTQNMAEQPLNRHDGVVTALDVNSTANDDDNHQDWENELPPEEAAAWRATMQCDEIAQASMSPQPPLSDVYVAGSQNWKPRRVLGSVEQSRDAGEGDESEAN